MIERGGQLYLTRQETSDRLTTALGRGYTIRSIDRLITAGKLRATKFDDIQWVYIPKADVERLESTRSRQVPDTGRRTRRTRKTTTLAVPGMTRAGT